MEGMCSQSGYSLISRRQKNKERFIGTIRPITILQAKRAQIIDDITHIIDREEINNVALIGVVRSITKSEMYVNYIIDDGTGVITVRKFGILDTEDTESNIKPEIYVQVHGRLRSFNNQNINIAANGVSAIQGYNQITFHLLDCIHTHLSKNRTRTMNELNINEDNADVANVKKAILECSSTESGAYIHSIIVYLNDRMVESDIMEVINDLLNRGDVTCTKDDYHLKLV
ncbi:hypothetical protein BDF21DRAFT_496660 [Thamnidium elegans]|nr:hypothetical protein BDF21DRAFT_496660 [Thamnidium elegans]